MRQVTGRPRERLHRFRHLVAFERTLPVVLSAEDLAWMESSGLKVTSSEADVALPRDLMERVVLLGHRDWRTTIRSYIHMPWLWRSRSDERIAIEYMSRREVAFAMGVTLQAVDNVSQKAKPSTPRAAWLQHVRRPRTVQGVVAGEPALPSSMRTHVWTALDLDALFKCADRVGGLQEAVRVSGGSDADYRNIAAGVAIIEQRIGGRLFRGVGPSPKRPRRVVRRLDPQFGDALLDWLDRSIRGCDSEVQELLSTIVDAMSPYDRPHVMAEAQAMTRLVSHVTRLTDGRVVAEVLPCDNAMARATFLSEADTTLVGDLKRAFGTAWLALRLGARRSEVSGGA